MFVIQTRHGHLCERQRPKSVYALVIQTFKIVLSILVVYVCYTNETWTFMRTAKTQISLRPCYTNKAKQL